MKKEYLRLDDKDNVLVAFRDLPWWQGAAPGQLLVKEIFILPIH